MSERILFFFIYIMTGLIGHAQVLPVPGAHLNYTQIMFEYEQVKGASSYIVQVVVDTPHASFEHCVAEQRDPATATMISGFDFGRKYKWRYAGIIDGHEPVWHGPWQFSIDSSMIMKARIYDLSVTRNDSAANAGGLIVNDGTYTITDRKGKVVWALPKINWQFNISRASRVTDSTIDQVLRLDITPNVGDLRLNPYGTITYIADSDIVECDLDGTKLWEKHHCGIPSEMGENAYNHVFMRLPDGHYMALGNEGFRKMPSHIDSTLARRKYSWRDTFAGIEYARVDFGTVLEYDKAGNVVWAWSSKDYFDRDGSAPSQPNMELKGHVNALAVDRTGEYVYVGFRDISRIIKIEKKTGRVVDSWGEQRPVGVGPVHHTPIHMQHDAAIQDDGSIIVFNNNDYPGTDSIPHVLIFSQAADRSGQVIWSYDYHLEPSELGQGRTRGNVERLKNGNILVSTGSVNRIFEVTRDKKIVWEATYKPKEFPGYRFSHILYRAHYVSSLYPCYFTFTIDRDTLTKESAKFNITIFNRGSEEDGYEITINEPGNLFISVLEESIKPNSSKSYALSTIDRKEPHQILVTVGSRTNPDLVRKKVIWYQ